LIHVDLYYTIDERTPRQNLWVNGQLELTAEVPISAYSSTAYVTFYLWNAWNRSFADVSLWSRCLLPIEIKAIYQQKTSIDKVSITKYIFDHLNE
jgi:hypothetical protein